MEEEVAVGAEEREVVRPQLHQRSIAHQRDRDNDLGKCQSSLKVKNI
jgi:hypothetical protein